MKNQMRTEMAKLSRNREASPDKDETMPERGRGAEVRTKNRERTKPERARTKADDIKDEETARRHKAELLEAQVNNDKDNAQDMDTRSEQ